MKVIMPTPLYATRPELTSPYAIDDEAPPSGETADSQVCGLNDLPNEMLNEIAQHLPLGSLRALACVNKRMGNAVASERQKIELMKRTLSQDIERFSWRSGLQAFLSLLPTIRGLHPDDRKQPLEALCARLNRLREAERKQAAEAILEGPFGLQGPLLDQLKVLARFGSPENAVIDGKPVDVIANCFNRDTDRLTRLAFSLGPIQAEIDAGKDTDVLEKRYGLSGVILPFRSTTVSLYRIFPDPSLYASQLVQACRAAYEGEPIDMAVNRCFEGGRLLYASRRYLEEAAVEGAAGEAAAHGEHVDVIAQRHGINSDESRLELERCACKGVAAEDADAGKRVADVAQRHGIQSTTYRLALLRHAMAGRTGDDVRSGSKTVAQVADEQGIDLSEIERIGIEAWRLPEIQRMAGHSFDRRVGPTEFLERGAKSGKRPADSVA